MTQPYILILGGRPKGERFGSLRPDRRCKHVIAYGEARQLIADDLKPNQDVEVVERFDDAVLRARDHARPGDVVLLSPACASFDQFESFTARGDQFRTIVEGL
jgi:UDP-N-acetylmuramoylalanine--D-glutamate ligase